MANEVITIENLSEFKSKFENNIKTINGESLIGSGDLVIGNDNSGWIYDEDSNTIYPESKTSNIVIGYDGTSYASSWKPTISMGVTSVDTGETFNGIKLLEQGYGASTQDNLLSIGFNHSNSYPYSAYPKIIVGDSNKSINITPNGIYRERYTGTTEYAIFGENATNAEIDALFK